MIVGLLMWPGLSTARAAEERNEPSASVIVTAMSPLQAVTAFAPPAAHRRGAVGIALGTAVPPTTGPTTIPPPMEPTSAYPPEDLAPVTEPAGDPGWLSRLIPIGLATVVLVMLWKKDVIRPGSLARKPGPRTIGPPWFVWVLAAIVVFMAAQVGSSLALALVGGRDPAGSELDAASTLPLRTLAIVSLASYAAAIATALAMAKLLAPTAEGFAVRARDGLVGIGCFVLTYPVVFAVSSISVLVAGLFREGEPPRVAHESLRRIIDHSQDHWAWVLAGTAIIGAPIVEEMIYRVFLQTGLVRAGRRPWAAIWGTALLFALAHAGVVEVYALPTLFVLGAAMGLAYERTKSPVVPIVMHVLFNGLNVLMAVWLDGG